jgi:altronate dehydratase small subunit
MTAPGPDKGIDAVVLVADDNVATALRALAKGETARVRGPVGDVAVVLGEPVPFGHKFATLAIATGAPVLKYGTPIGRATARIEKGAHVHTHNLISGRARPASD